MNPCSPRPRPIRLAPIACAAALACFLIGLDGCATVGREFPSERVHEIRNGQTTKSDLLSRFGRPHRRGIEDGDSTWTYMHYKWRLIGGQTMTRDLFIRFDGDKVRSYTYSADS